MKTACLFLSAFLFIPMISQDSLRAQDVVDVESLGYSVYLPDGWIIDQASGDQHFLYDTSASTNTWSYISIKRYLRDASTYPHEEDWTRANFIAYELVARHSYDPWGFVLYTDSSQTKTQNGLWSPEAYVEYYGTDSVVGAWAEFVRFTASGSYGYELSAVGDTADIYSNIGFYAAIIKSIVIPEIVALEKYPHLSLNNKSSGAAPAKYFDCLGRTVNASGKIFKSATAQQLFVSPEKKQFYFKP